MRPYRGKRKDNEEWVKGDKVEIGKRCWIVSRPEITESDDMREIHCSIWGFVEVIPETVGQFTGLKDKNGKEIYEGDIVKFSTNDKDWEKAVIEFQEHSYNAGFYPNKSTNASCYWEVIGDIHSNPELLEAKNDRGY